VLAVPFDTLKLARALRDRAGFSQEHAEAAADALAEVLGEQVATKQDIKDLRTEIDVLRTEMVAGFRDVEQRLTIRLGGMLVVVTGVLLAAKFFG
jgi:hypothetical protein